MSTRRCLAPCSFLPFYPYHIIHMYTPVLQLKNQRNMHVAPTTLSNFSNTLLAIFTIIGARPLLLYLVSTSLCALFSSVNCHPCSARYRLDTPIASGPRPMNSLHLQSLSSQLSLNSHAALVQTHHVSPSSFAHTMHECMHACHTR